MRPDDPQTAAPVGGALELRARQIAADKMGLIKDPTGMRLPDEMWRQALPQAEAEAALAPVSADTSDAAVPVAYMVDCGKTGDGWGVRMWTAKRRAEAEGCAQEFGVKCIPLYAAAPPPPAPVALVRDLADRIVWAITPGIDCSREKWLIHRAFEIDRVEQMITAALSAQPAPVGLVEAALLREVVDKGLIYWEPNTTRGAVAKADMLRRCEAALSAQATPVDTYPSEADRKRDAAKGVQHSYRRFV